VRAFLARPVYVPVGAEALLVADRMGTMGLARCVVAVDGPSGSGKSTVSRRLALALDARYLDTGAMYRAATWAVLQAGIDLADIEGIIKVVNEIEITVGTDPSHQSVQVNGVNVDTEIRGAEVTAAVSAVSAVPRRSPGARRPSAST
jgi:cytidylate kinase